MSSHLSHDSERTPAADASVHDEAVLGAPTVLWGTLAQEKSQMQRSSSASSSQEPPKVRQRSCSQLSTPDPDAPEPHSAGNTHTHAAGRFSVIEEATETDAAGRLSTRVSSGSTGKCFQFKIPMLLSWFNSHFFLLLLLKKGDQRHRWWHKIMTERKEGGEID